eukprot:1690256-Rhodomonas_salina.3
MSGGPWPAHVYRIRLWDTPMGYTYGTHLGRVSRQAAPCQRAYTVYAYGIRLCPRVCLVHACKRTTRIDAFAQIYAHETDHARFRSGRPLPARSSAAASTSGLPAATPAPKKNSAFSEMISGWQRNPEDSLY